MGKKLTNAAIKAIGFLGSALLTIFAGIFGLMAISALVLSIIEKDFYSVIGCLSCAVISWTMWSIRKDTLL